MIELNERFFTGLYYCLNHNEMSYDFDIILTGGLRSDFMIRSEHNLIKIIRDISRMHDV